MARAVATLASSPGKQHTTYKIREQAEEKPWQT